MKQTIIDIITVLLIIIGIIIMVFIPIIRLADANTREIKAQVVSINDSIITVEDTTGNLWEFESDEYFLGEVVRIKFNTLGTETIYDDIIIGVKGV